MNEQEVKCFESNLKIKYNSLWSNIHSLNNKYQSENYILKTLNTIFDELDIINQEIYTVYQNSKEIRSRTSNENTPKLNIKPPCMCRNNAEKVLLGMLNNDMKNLGNIDDIASFFKIFHNEINLKLGKDIFFFNNNN